MKGNSPEDQAECLSVKRQEVLGRIQSLHAQGPMLKEEWQEIRARLGLSHREMADLLGLHYLTSFRFARGAQKIGMKTALLVRLINQL